MGCEYRQRLVSAGGSEGPWLTGGGDVGVGHRVSVGLGVMDCARQSLGDDGV